MRLLRPTPVPTPTEIISICTGKARLTAARAFTGSYWETKMLSTMLYSACTSMENMAGRAIEKIRGRTGMVPILFSSNAITPFPVGMEPQPQKTGIQNSFFKLALQC